jgi:sigma-B regulation protein RsbU (phosphoserine phosphatase)
VLIIDDSPLNVRLLEAIFVKEGFRVLKAGSGSVGRTLARTHSPDLILLDIIMPGETGFETCTALKADPATTDIPVIFITGLADVEEKVKGFALGAVDYITKPVDRAEVLARARLHIRLWAAHAALIEEQSARLRQLREAQQAILVRPEDCPAARFAVHYKPFHEVGGDFYDVVENGGYIFGYFVADVSGHDLGASFSTSALKVLTSQNAGPLYTPEETMKMMNGVMSSVLPEGQFLTACYAQLNRLRSKLTIVNAGHPPAVFVSSNGEAEIIRAPGDVMGVFPSVTFDVYERSVSKGDRFFLCTDGLIERFGDWKKTWREGIDALAEACEETKGVPLEGAVRQIVDALCPDGDTLEDDVVLLGVEV